MIHQHTHLRPFSLISTPSQGIYGRVPIVRYPCLRAPDFLSRITSTDLGNLSLLGQKVSSITSTITSAFVTAAAIALLAVRPAYSDNDVMMQAFYWDVPVDAAAGNGTWWDNLNSKALDLSTAGITAVWVPSPSKGNFGIYDMGYGIYDHYDLGNYEQKGTTETRFGSRAELEAMLQEMHDNQIDVYADVVLNHIYAGTDDLETNPAVKQYVFDEAFRNGTQFVPYPTNEIRWVIPNAAPGDYYIRVKGYSLPFEQAKGERGYDINIDWTGVALDDGASYVWESEPNNGGGNFNAFPASGEIVRGHIASPGDIDEYVVTLHSPRDIFIKLTARREDTSNGWSWHYASQSHGYYPFEVWHNGIDLAQNNATLEAKTSTGIQYPTHTGPGEANFSWTYSDFHPVDDNDWLGDGGFEDSLVTNTKWFGNDFNTFSSVVQTRLNDWGYWLADEIGFDGFRLDFVRGIQPWFVADWVVNLPLSNGAQRFIVGEYWTNHTYRLRGWVEDLASGDADGAVFDFPLRDNLKRMCNDPNYEMHWLNHAGMVRDLTNSLPKTSVVTFVDNHDTGKESDKWVGADFGMAYSYILTHEGRPTIFYPHYYAVTQHDHHDGSTTVTAPAGLQEDLNKLMFIRRTYLGGSLEVLSEVGNPWPPIDTRNVYVARRGGNGLKEGAIVVINNQQTEKKGLRVDSSPTGFTDWAGETLVNALNPSVTANVHGDGRVYLDAPSRGWTVWVKQSDYETYVSP